MSTIYYPISQTIGNQQIPTKKFRPRHYTLLGAVPYQQEFYNRLNELRTFFQYHDLSQYNVRLGQYDPAIDLVTTDQYIAVYGRVSMPFYHLQAIQEYVATLGLMIYQCNQGILTSLDADHIDTWIEPVQWDTSIGESDGYRHVRAPVVPVLALFTCNRVMKDQLKKFQDQPYGWEIDLKPDYTFLFTVSGFSIRKADEVKCIRLQLLPLLSGLLPYEVTISIDEFTELVDEQYIVLFVSYR